MINAILEQASDLEGRARVRILDRGDAKYFVDRLCKAAKKADETESMYLRVYPADAFVCNSYRGVAKTTCIQLKGGVVEVLRVSAFRSFGVGPLVVARGF